MIFFIKFNLHNVVDGIDHKTKYNKKIYNNSSMECKNMVQTFASAEQ